MTRYFLILLFLFLGVIGTCPAQTTDTVAASTQEPSHRYLLLTKVGTAVRYRIYTGENITFQLVGEKQMRSGAVQGFRGNSFYVQGMEVPLKTVEKVRLRNHTGGRKVANFGGSFLKTAGAVFTLVGAINFFANADDRKDGLQTMGAAITLYGAGIGLHALRKGTYTLNSKWQLKIMEMY
ncbi:hypothetical protein TH63_00855 [Rufibacter radiotolerans]|uniref:Uncharacterized protein n=1 Tax=Rufibacter radiotolerans TaxID=1379910 RepID=A0A0H4VKU0_9BACT|nr:hypothetical protein [Rufibacter radiotolerans]AKQ44507.1 hypothetical protein TH63_00855 [Rufibacter radiotolerans]